MVWASDQRERIAVEVVLVQVGVKGRAYPYQWQHLHPLEIAGIIRYHLPWTPFYVVVQVTAQL